MSFVVLIVGAYSHKHSRRFEELKVERVEGVAGNWKGER